MGMLVLAVSMGATLSASADPATGTGLLEYEDFDDGVADHFYQHMPPSFKVGNFSVSNGAYFANASDSWESWSPAFRGLASTYNLLAGLSATATNYCARFLYQPNAASTTDYEFRVIVRSNPAGMGGWRFTIRRDGRLVANRDYGTTLGPDILTGPVPGTETGVFGLDSPQWAKFYINGEIPDVHLQAKRWIGSAEDEPTEFILDVYDRSTDNIAPGPGICLQTIVRPQQATDSAVGAAFDEFMARALTPEGDLEYEDFDDGLANNFYPTDAAYVGAGDFVIHPGQRDFWTNGVYRIDGQKYQSGPMFGIGLTMNPLDSRKPYPLDHAVAFRVIPELATTTADYAFRVTMRPDEKYGSGWVFIIGLDGSIELRRYNGFGNFDPPIWDPPLAEAPAGTVAAKPETDQYVRFSIDGLIGNVHLKTYCSAQGPFRTEPPDHAFLVIDYLDDSGISPGDGLHPADGVVLTCYYEPLLTEDVTATDTLGTRIDDFAAYDLSPAGCDKGDVDADGDYDLFDVLRTVDIVLDKPPEPTDWEWCAADMDSDDDVDLFDILALVDLVLED